MDNIAKTIIENSFSTGKTFHSWIINSQNKQLAENILLFLISKIQNTTIEKINKNFFQFTKENPLDKDILKEVIKKMTTSAEKNENNILVIENVENLHIATLNSLLKFIEEPNKNTFIIFTTKNIKAVLKTIVSRSFVLNLKNPKHELLTKNDVINELLSLTNNSKDKIEKFINSFESELHKIKTTKDFFSFLILNWQEENHSIFWFLFFALIKNLILNKHSFIQKQTIINLQKILNLSYKDYEFIMLMINDFNEKKHYYVNFELQKMNFIVRLKERFLKNEWK
ncbi:hypothetical protein [Mycoplasma sp. 1012]